MQSFEGLLKQENLGYCVSGHSVDTGMDFEEVLQFYRRRGLREEPNVRFMRQRDGSKFFVDDLVDVHVFAPPFAENVQNAQLSGIDVKSHVEIHPGKEYFTKMGLNAAMNELRLLMQHHVDNKIPAAAYTPYQREFQCIHKP
ncbi:hypothetical protein HYX06_03280 [Candidatus Woesearchaeota archaeon]|nr:hypothetical protein [Candidatus Woesearchaeota archaeon]